METQGSCIPEKNRQNNNLLKRVILRSSSKVANQKRYHGTSAEHCKIHMHAFLSQKHELNHYLSLYMHTLSFVRPPSILHLIFSYGLSQME